MKIKNNQVVADAVNMNISNSDLAALDKGINTAAKALQNIEVSRKKVQQMVGKSFSGKQLINRALQNLKDAEANIDSAITKMSDESDEIQGM